MAGSYIDHVLWGTVIGPDQFNPDGANLQLLEVAQASRSAAVPGRARDARDSARGRSSTGLRIGAVINWSPETGAELAERLTPSGRQPCGCRTRGPSSRLSRPSLSHPHLRRASSTTRGSRRSSSTPTGRAVALQRVDFEFPGGYPTGWRLGRVGRGQYVARSHLRGCRQPQLRARSSRHERPRDDV